jgi:hypothetical protein
MPTGISKNVMLAWKAFLVSTVTLVGTPEIGAGLYSLHPIKPAASGFALQLPHAHEGER